VEAIHKGRAAKTPTARAQSAANSGAIADTQGSHLDSSAKSSAEFAEKRPKIEPLLGRKKDNGLTAGQGKTSLDGSHIEPELTRTATKVGFDFALDVVGVLVSLFVLARGQSDHPSNGTSPFPINWKRKKAHLSQKLPVGDFDQVRGFVTNFELPDSAGHGRQIWIDDHRYEILGDGRNRDLCWGQAHDEPA
jgi:hypothetical protein